MTIRFEDINNGYHQVDYTTCDDVSFSITMEPSDVLDQSGTTGELSVAAGVTSTVLVKVTFTVSIGNLWTSDEKQSWILIGAT